ncbi:MAG: single-stranded DNA-binding protein [Flavobacteriales bacterium]|nr:single-stranded DNA-binding protein [Flavobacteriales bacterium]
MKQLRNKVQLIGRLGRDPEVKEINGGKKMAKWSIATDETYRNTEGEIVKETQWHNVVAWGKLAEIAEKYLHKGQEICVEGKLSNRSYEDKSGETKYVTEVVASDVLMLGKKAS